MFAKINKRNIFGIALIVALIAVLAFCLVACAPKDIDMSAVELSDTTFTYDGTAKTLEIKNLPSGVSYEFEIVDVDGNRVAPENVVNVGEYFFTAIFSVENGKKFKTPESMMARLAINKANYDLSNFRIEGLEYNYDGQEHRPTLSGVPAGVQASVKLYDGDVEIQSAVAVDTYRVEVTFEGDANHNAISARSATLAISKGAYDMTGFAINGLESAYDGQEHRPTVSGVPQGAQATLKLYDGDVEIQSAVNAGQYRVEVTFTVDDNHENIAQRNATLTIAKADYDMSSFAISGLVYDYDGDAHVPAISGVPTGVQATVKLYDGQTEIQNATEIGVYNVEVTFTGDTNHNDIEKRTAKLIIKGAYDMTAFTITGLSGEYDGSVHSPLLSGVPDGVETNIKYYVDDAEVQRAVNAGEYRVEITFEVDECHYAIEKRTATLTIAPKQLNAHDIVTFEDESRTYNGKYQEFLVEGTVPEWVEIEYKSNLRKAIGTQTASIKVKSNNPNYAFSNADMEAEITILPYVYSVDDSSATLDVVATADKIKLTVRNLGELGNTAEVVYFHSYEYFVIDEDSGVSTNRTDGTVVDGVVYNCGTTQTIEFDRFLPSGFDLIYCKFSLRVGTVGEYELLHNPMYCVSIASRNNYSYDLNTSVKGLDYPPWTSTSGAERAADVDAHFITFNLLLKDWLCPNEYVDDEGNIVDNMSHIDLATTTPYVVNGVTYYMKNFYIDYLDAAVAYCREHNIKIVPCLYNWNETNMLENPYFATYPDARDTGSMIQFALNSSNAYGEGYIIACVEFMMDRYCRDGGGNVIKDLIIGNELDLARAYYPIQTYQGNEIYSPRKFAAEYVRTLRLANNAVKKYVPDGNVYAPFSRYMNSTNLTEKGSYTIVNLLNAISYNSKLEGDFDWGVVIHPYDWSYPYDVVKSATTKTTEYFPTYETRSISYGNLEVIDKFLRQDYMLYNGKVLRKVVFDEAGIKNQTTNAKNKQRAMASMAFAYYRAATLDSTYALILSDTDMFQYSDEARAMWRDIDKEGTLELTGDIFKILEIYNRETKELKTAEELGITTWEEMMDIWNDPDMDWEALWNENKFVVVP